MDFRHYLPQERSRLILLVVLTVITLLVWAVVGGLWMWSRSTDGVDVRPTSTATNGPQADVVAIGERAFSISGRGWPTEPAVELSVIPASGTPAYWLGTARPDAQGTFRIDFPWGPGLPTGPGSRLVARSGAIEVISVFEVAPPLGDASPTPEDSDPAETPTLGVTPTAAATETEAVAISPSATPSSRLVCNVAEDQLNLRERPTTTSTVLTRLGVDTLLEALARSRDGAWVAVVTEAGDRGWVNAQFISCPPGGLAALPIEADAVAPSSTPQPSATPGGVVATATRPLASATVAATGTSVVVITEWRGEYWNNAGFVGSPVLVRNDSRVSFDWGTASPAANVPADSFSARWTRVVRFTPGPYRFTVRADDGARLYIDNVLVLDMWRQGPLRSQSVDMTMSAGDHQIRLEYFEAGSTASVGLSWDQQNVVFAGWRGEYFANTSLTGTPTLIRDDASLAFNWGSGSPDPVIPNDNFSARWTREFEFEPGSYTFRAVSDDGVRVFVDNAPVIDQWQVGARETSTDVTLTRGRHTVRVEYFETSGGARVEVVWQRRESFPNWKGEYWNNPELRGDPDLVRNDANIAFDWGSRNPGQGIRADDFSVRWTGRFQFDAGSYRFHAQADDGMRLWVNERLVLDAWSTPGNVDQNVDVAIPSAGLQSLRVEYLEQTGDAVVNLWWERLVSTAVPPTVTRTPTATTVPPTPTNTPPPTATTPPTATASATATTLPSTNTPPPTATATATATTLPATATATVTVTQEATPTETGTATVTATQEATATETETPTVTVTSESS